MEHCKLLKSLLIKRYDTWWNGSMWQDSKLGGNGNCIPAKPAPLCGFSSNRMDIFWKSKTGQFVDTWWNGSMWQDSVLVHNHH